MVRAQHVNGQQENDFLRQIDDSLTSYDIRINL